LADCNIAGVRSGQQLTDLKRVFGTPTEPPTKLTVGYRARDAACVMTVVVANQRIEGGRVKCDPAAVPR
jgi:hypothetical protein